MTSPEPSTRALLDEMLRGFGVANETPLRFGIDAPRIVAAALARVGPPDDLARTVRALDGAILEALHIESDSRSDERAKRPAMTPPIQSAESVLAAWLEQTHILLRAVHPWAPHVLAMRVAGEDDREIAAHLGTGLRLTRRLVADLRTSWIEAVRP